MTVQMMECVAELSVYTAAAKPVVAGQVAGSPELYPIMVEMGCIPTLLACLSHENTDIAADTIELFSELTGSGQRHRGGRGVDAREQMHYFAPLACWSLVANRCKWRRRSGVVLDHHHLFGCAFWFIAHLW